MATLQDFDQALKDSSGADGDAWADDGVVFVGKLAAALSDDELVLLGLIWSDRPPLWQKHCAEVLGQARHVKAIEVLLDLVHRARPEVALAALEFDPRLLAPGQTLRVMAAIEALLAQSVGSLHRVLLEKYLTRLRAAGAPAE